MERREDATETGGAPEPSAVPAAAEAGPEEGRPLPGASASAGGEPGPKSEGPAEGASASAKGPLLAAAATTALVTVLSYAVPERHAATAVGLAFLGATYLLVLRHDEATVRAHGLSLGGLLEPTRLSPARLLRSGLRASLWALALAAVFFPPFFYGYGLYWGVRRPFRLLRPRAPFDEIVGQLLVVALPEEAFYRGYLQTALDRAWKPRWRLLGADLGWGWLVSSAIFAAGHYFTSPHPARLAVFFPSLVFGWMRARTGGVGAGALFHAACNLFSATLARGYGFS